VIYETVVSTMPLPSLVKMLDAPGPVLQAAKSLKFRNTLLVYLLVEGYDHFTDNWIYVHSPTVDFGRVTNFRNWSPHLYGDSTDTVLCLEYWCDDDEALWKAPDEALIIKAKEELLRSGLIKKGDVLKGAVCRVPKSYPVFDIGYKKNLEVIKRYLAQYDRLCSIGRYGAFKYNNQDHSLLMGLKAAEGILSGFKGDLSAINAQAIYEEDFAITDQVLSEFEEI
jgi:protoporphyrinogen oxidase